MRASTRLPAPVNSSDQSLHLIPVYFQESHGHFSFTLRPLCAAKAFPPQPPPRPRGQPSAVIWRGLGFQHFSDISRFLNFMGKSPQTCLSSSWRRADVQVHRLHTRADLCQRSRLVLSDCKHTLLSGIMYHHPPFGQRGEIRGTKCCGDVCSRVGEDPAEMEVFSLISLKLCKAKHSHSGIVPSLYGFECAFVHICSASYCQRHINMHVYDH